MMSRIPVAYPGGPWSFQVGPQDRVLHIVESLGPLRLDTVSDSDEVPLLLSMSNRVIWEHAGRVPERWANLWTLNLWVLIRLCAIYRGGFSHFTLISTKLGYRMRLSKSLGSYSVRIRNANAMVHSNPRPL